MLSVLLFASAFIYFILDRKVRLTFVPGSAVMFVLGIPTIWNALTSFLSTRRNIKIIHSLGIKNLRQARNVLTVVLTLIVIPLCIAALYFLGRFISRCIFTPAGENGRNRKLAKVLYVVASGVLVLSGFVQIIFSVVAGKPARLRTIRYLRTAMKSLALLGDTIRTMRLYGVILLILGTCLIILILTVRPLLKAVTAEGAAGVGAGAGAPGAVGAPEQSSRNKQLITGIILSAGGNYGVWTIATVSFLMWKKVYFFTGYTYTKILCIICIALMTAGTVFMILGLSKKQNKVKTVLLVLTIVLFVLSFIDLGWLLLH